MNTFNLKFANRLGIFFVGLFAICFVWYFIRPVEQELHLAMFRLAYFGFDRANLAGFLFGAVQSYFWAYVGVGVWQFVLLFTSKK